MTFTCDAVPLCKLRDSGADGRRGRNVWIGAGGVRVGDRQP
jgi:hypothetical protein